MLITERALRNEIRRKIYKTLRLLEVKEDEYFVQDADGVYAAKTALSGKVIDPYTYKVVRIQPGESITLKVMSATKEGEKRRVGKKWKITKDNIDNPNVRILYAAIVSDNPEAEIEEESRESTAKTEFLTARGSGSSNTMLNQVREYVKKAMPELKELDYEGESGTNWKNLDRDIVIATVGSGDNKYRNMNMGNIIASIKKELEKFGHVIAIVNKWHSSGGSSKGGLTLAYGLKTGPREVMISTIPLIGNIETDSSKWDNKSTKDGEEVVATDTEVITESRLDKWLSSY